MNYTITLIVSAIVIGFGIISFFVYRLVYVKQSKHMLSGTIKKIGLPKLRVVRNCFLILALVIIVPIFMIDTAFIPKNQCSTIYDYRSVNKWESKLNSDQAYKMCFCAEGYPVFKDPNAAFLRLFIDNPEGVSYLINNYKQPLTRLNYRKFLSFYSGGDFSPTTPAVLKQVNRILLILSTYKTSFNANLVPIDERADQTTISGILSIGFESIEILNYAFLDEEIMIESEEGYSYLYVRFYIENLTKSPYTINSDSIKIVSGSEDREIISTIDTDKIDKNITGVIAAGSIRSGLLVIKVDKVADNILQFMDDRISKEPFEFKIE